MITLKPTLIHMVPRLLNRMYDDVNKFLSSSIDPAIFKKIISEKIAALA
jgi:long-subunit acyl-CoA synthetase (AMP-forming)